MNKKLSINRGFTLIELIVVVTIIAVLTVVGVISFTGTNKKSRDARRMADLEKIRIALEMYRQTNKVYPIDTGGTFPYDGYLQSWPQDPKSTYYYQYAIETSYTYTLKAQMEDLGSTNVAGVAGCGSDPTDKCNYQVGNP